MKKKSKPRRVKPPSWSRPMVRVTAMVLLGIGEIRSLLNDENKSNGAIVADAIALYHSAIKAEQEGKNDEPTI